MLETYGNLWEYHDRGEWICITTNGDVRKDGCAVMGRGVALQAKHRFPKLPYLLGKRITRLGNHVQRFETHRLFSFPVKHHWSDRADFNLIRRSCAELMSRLKRSGPNRVVLPRPGCGNGQLDWNDVRDVIFERLDNRVLVITNGRRC